MMQRSRACSTVAPAFAVALLAVGGCTVGSPATEGERLAEIERRVEAIRARYPDVATMSVDALLHRLEDEDLVLVDVRTKEEQAVSMLPGAIPREAFESRLDQLAGRTVVAYCTIGVRSSAYAREMAAQGVDVVNLEGSALAWTHAGGELVDGSAPTTRIHVYGRSWNLAADGYSATW